MQQLNELFDIIVLGASLEGIALCEYVKAKSPEKKVALVSRHFRFVKDGDKLGDTVKVEGESIYSSFNHGLVILTLKDRRTVVGKNLVIATGSSPIKTTAFKNVNVCYNPRDLETLPKNRSAVVYGANADAVKYALAMSKRFKYVYLCSHEMKLGCDAKMSKKLNDTANVVHLPNCSITACKNNKEGKLCEVMLDTYDSINCSALVLALGKTPDVNGIDQKMVELDQDRSIKINTQHQTTRVHNIYAIGECAKHNTKRSITTVGNCLIRGGK